MDVNQIHHGLKSYHFKPLSMQELKFLGMAGRCYIVGFDHGLPFCVKNMARGTQ